MSNTLKNDMSHMILRWKSRYVNNCIITHTYTLIKFYESFKSDESNNTTMENLKKYYKDRRSVDKKVFIKILESLAVNIDEEINNAFIKYKQEEDEKIQTYNINKTRVKFRDFTNDKYGLHPFVHEKIKTMHAKYSLMLDTQRNKIIFYSSDINSLKDKLDEMILKERLDWNIKNVFEFVYDVDSNPIKNLRLD